MFQQHCYNVAATLLECSKMFLAYWALISICIGFKSGEEKVELSASFLQWNIKLKKYFELVFTVEQ